MPGAEKETPKRGELRLEAISYHSKESWTSLRVCKIGSKEWGGHDETDLKLPKGQSAGCELGRIPLNPFLSREEGNAALETITLEAEDPFLFLFLFHITHSFFPITSTHHIPLFEPSTNIFT
jgi:hypothetical protein